MSHNTCAVYTGLVRGKFTWYLWTQLNILCIEDCHIGTSARNRTCVNLLTHTHLQMHAHTHLHSYKNTHIHALIYACLQIHMHAHTQHTHTHTFRHTLAQSLYPLESLTFSNVLSNKLKKSKSDIDITGFGLKNALSVLMLTLETKLAGFCVCAQK